MLKEGDIIAIDKPKGITSHDVIDKIRHITGIRRVGHGGTLDPLASGVLVIGIGRSATKQLDKYVKGGKEYKAIIKLGQTSTTDDEEGEKTNVSDKKPTQKEIEKILKKFIGNISQTPPIYSALKHQRKPLYKYARNQTQDKTSINRFIEAKKRDVEIKKIDLLNYVYPVLNISVTCGTGVYIRALARDIGERLGTGAYLANLKRTRVAEFTLEKSWSIESFSA